MILRLVFDLSSGLSSFTHPAGFYFSISYLLAVSRGGKHADLRGGGVGGVGPGANWVRDWRQRDEVAGL